MGYSFQLTERVLLYAPSHRQDSTSHGLWYISRGALAGTRNSSMGPRWRIDPTTHRTMSKRSYHSATSHFHVWMKESLTTMCWPQDQWLWMIKHACMDFLQQNAITTILWSQQSPNLNPVENLWDILGERFSRIVSSMPPGMMGNPTASDPGHEMYKEERNALFNDALNTLIWIYGIGHMVKDHSDQPERKAAAATWVTLSD